MKKLIIKTVLFLGLILLAIVLSEKYFIKENRFNFTKVTFDYLSSKDCFNILFFGSSKSYCSYNPAIFRNDINASTYNLAGQGQVLEVTKFIIEDALKKTTPDIVVVDISYNMIVFSEIDSISNPKKSYQLRVLDNYRLSFNKIKTMFSVYQAKDAISAMSPLIRNHKDWNLVCKRNFKKPHFEDKNNLFLGNNGYIGALHEISAEGIKMAKGLEKEYKAALRISSLQLTDKETKIIEAIEDLVKAKGVQLMFVSAPSIKAYTKHLSFYDNLEHYFKSKNIAYLNLNKHFKYIGLTTDDFKDTQHMNYSGGYKTSKFLASEIYKKGLPNKPKDNYVLNNNVSYHMLNKLEKTELTITKPFQFNDQITVKKAGYFEEFNDSFVFLFQIDKKMVSSNKSYRGYIRYYNAVVNEKNKKVISFPVKTINIEDDIYTFARINLTNLEITKLDVFFIEKGTNKVSKTFTLRDLKLKNGIR